MLHFSLYDQKCADSWCDLLDEKHIYIYKKIKIMNNILYFIL